jgi:hypothetical protein
MCERLNDKEEFASRIEEAEIKAPVETDVFWWKTFPELTEVERKTFELVFEQGMDLDEVAEEMGLLSANVFQYFKSGMRRYVISLEEIRQTEANMEDLQPNGLTTSEQIEVVQVPQVTEGKRTGIDSFMQTQLNKIVWLFFPKESGLQNNLTVDEIEHLTFLAKSAQENGNQRRFEIVLTDPLFFLDRKQESVSEPVKYLPDTYGELKVPHFGLKKKEEVSPKQQLKACHQIIEQQEERIKTLEVEITHRLLTSSEFLRQTDFILMQRPWGSVKFNVATRTVGSEEVGFVRLTLKESAILDALVRCAGIPLDKKNVITLVSSREVIVGDNRALWVSISRLRKKLWKISPLLAKRLRTIRDFGYLWEDESFSSG